MFWFCRLLVLIVGMVLVQVSLLPTLLGHWPIPNLVFAAMLVTFVKGNLVESLWWAGLGGLLLDLTLPGRGFYTFVLAVLIGGLSLFSTRWGLRTQGLVTVTIVLVTALVVTGVEWFVSGGTWSVDRLWALISQVLGVGLIFTIYRLSETLAARRSGRLLELVG